MRKNTVFFTHTVAAYAMYILGNAVIIMPVSTANEYTFLGYMAATAVAFALLLVLTPILSRVFLARTENIGKIKKVMLGIFYFVTALFALWCAADTFKSFTDFAEKILLKGMPQAFGIIIFFFVVLYFAFRRQENVLKFCLLAFWFVLAVVLFFFIACIGRYNLRNIFVFKLPQLQELISQAKPYIINPVIPALILPVYNALVFKSKASRAVFTGLATGFSVLGLCTMGSVLLFGSEFAGELEFPYAAAVSTVTVGRLFTRLDEFSYFVYFVTSLTRITVCLFAMLSCLKKINKLSKRRKLNEKSEK